MHLHPLLISLHSQAHRSLFVSISWTSKSALKEKKIFLKNRQIRDSKPTLRLIRRTLLQVSNYSFYFMCLSFWGIMTNFQWKLFDSLHGSVTKNKIWIIYKNFSLGAAVDITFLCLFGCFYRINHCLPAMNWLFPFSFWSLMDAMKHRNISNINNFDLRLDLYNLVFRHYLKKQQMHNPLDLEPILRGCKGIYLLLKNTEDICSRIQNWNHQFALFSDRNMHWHYEYSRFLPICHKTMHHICRTCKIKTGCLKRSQCY